MKVEKINKINSFGQFNNFKWPEDLDLPKFYKYNFFYGWNYSGKTTLSRIFRCFELKKLHSDYQEAEFEIQIDGKIFTGSDLNQNIPIRVFNEDFIEENFDWNNENADIEPVLILGKESKELEEELKQKQKEKSDKENELKKINEDKESKESKERELQNKLRVKASEIRNILSITNPQEFSKNKLEEVINDIKDNFLEKVLRDEEYQKYKNIINSQKLDKISLQKISLNLTKFLNDVKEILEKKVSAHQIIEKLNQNARLSNWVREGIELHKKETTCQFCGNKLTTERIAELNKHFSKEFDDFINLIKQKENEINNHLSEIDRYSLPDKARFYNQFQNEYEELVKNYNQLKLEYLENVKKLINELNKKKEKPFDELIIAQNINIEVENELLELLDKIQNLISEHNDKSNTLEEEKNQAKEKIKLHNVAIFIEVEKYLNKKQDIDSLDNDNKRIEGEIKILKSEISNIESKIKANAIGAQRLNELLNKFFNDDRLIIENTPNGKYKLYRNNKIAKNLSTGERNIISLLYFFVKLEETNFDLSQAIIFIDDPVSSLDSNHIHSVHAFLNEKIKNINQVFITTHNFDFFNLLKDMHRYDLKNQDGNFYLIKAITNNQNRYSTLEKLPDILRKFRSEYNYLFLKIFNYSNDKNSFEQLYLLPNILRRFFEMYLFLRYPDGKKFKEKANKFFENNISNEGLMALKIMDEYSHEENPEHSLRFPDITELKKSVEFVLNKISEKDKEHLDALVDSCK